MSYDDGSLDGQADRIERRGLAGTVSTVVRKLLGHVREWPGKYVEMRTRRYER